MSIIFIQLSYVTLFLQSIYNVCSGNFDTSTWTALFVSLSVGENTVWGWYLSLFATNSMDLAYAVAQAAVATYFMSCCYYINTMCEHLIFMVRSIQSDIELNQQEINLQTRKINYRKIRGKSHESIEFHITIYE